ncbi:type II toxin-antitoxin system VapC family toxin [Neomoorella humiferrea]|uniref:PIN domain-containing protein n=1 Tax=Neomoorella humiferrea TaxID=676965 RepID=A0A2T0ANY1_9FIRM|nr:hypothetical protein MOHU_18220 [Moorella humiferrea]
MTLLELLVKPKSLGLEEVCEQYITTLKSYPNLQLIDFYLEIAVLGAEIRAKYRVRTPDAIQLASALASDATLFFTNDLSLPRAFFLPGRSLPHLHQFPSLLRPEARQRQEQKLFHPGLRLELPPDVSPSLSRSFSFR